MESIHHGASLLFYLPFAFEDDDKTIANKPFEAGDSQYHYIETTDQWDIGAVPNSIDRSNVSVMPL